MNQESEIEEFSPWLVIFIILVGGFVRVLMLGTKGMWLDETFSVWLANHSAAEMLRWIVQIDQHPPLYYLLLHAWIGRFGDTPYNARLLSVLFGLATIPVIYMIGRRLSGGLMGLAAALLLALSPFNIRYAQETRMYTLLTFNVAVAIYALVRLLTDPRSVQPIGSQLREFLRSWRSPAPLEPKTDGDFSYRDKSRDQTGWRAVIARIRTLPIHTISTDLSWIALILFTAATLLTHNTAVFFLLAINLFVFGLIFFQRSRETATTPAIQAPSLGNWIKAQIAILLLWSPWILPFIQQSSRVYHEFWVPQPTGEIVLHTLRSFLNETSPAFAGRVWYMWVLYALVLGLGVLHYRKKLSRLLLLATLFTVPVLGELLVSIRRPIFLDRTLIWVSIPLLLLLAAGITQLRFRFLVIVLLGIFATNNLSSAGDYYRFAQREDWSNPAGYVANFAQKDDLVLFNASWVQIPFDYYLQPYEELYAIQVEKRGLPVDMFDAGILEPKMTENDLPRLASLLNGRKRAWLVYSHHWYTDPDGLIPRAIESEMELVQKKDYYGVQLYLYEEAP